MRYGGIDPTLWNGADEGLSPSYSMHVTIPVPSAVLSALVAAELIAATDRSDNDKVRTAIMHVIEDGLGVYIARAREEIRRKALVASDSWGHGPRTK